MGILTRFDRDTASIVPKRIFDPHDMHEACVDAMTKIACDRPGGRKCILDFVMEMIRYQAKLNPFATEELNKVINILGDVKADLRIITLYLQE
jgi:hypothetical protein